MNRFVYIAGGMLVILAAFLALRYWPSSRGSAPGLSASFTQSGLLRVEHDGRAAEVEVLDARGHVVARAKTHGGTALEVPLSWTPGEIYEVVAGDARTSVRGPANPPAVAVRLHAPLGQPPHEFFLARPFPPSEQHSVALPLAPGEHVDVLLEVEKIIDDDDPIPVAVHSEFAAGNDANALDIEPAWQDEKETLSFELDKAMLTTRIGVGERLPQGPWRVAVDVAECRVDLDVHCVPPTLDAAAVEVAAWRMPTDATGHSEAGRPSNQIVMPNALWDRLATQLGVRPPRFDPARPFTFQTLDLVNRTEQPISLLLLSEIGDARTGERVPFFDAPSWQSGSGTNTTMAFVQLAPGATAPCVLPIHVSPGAPAGRYMRRVTITPLGSDRVLATLTQPLGIVRAKPFFSLWVALVAAVTLVWLGGILVFYRRLIRSMGVRALVLLSLLGSLQFCLTFAGGWVSSALYAILGPFNCLVGGFLTEMLTYLLVTVILYQLPRVGAMTIAGLVSYLMGGILFGAFGLTDLLFVGSAIAFREVFLVLFRVTSFSKQSRTPALAPMMLALGLADAASTFTSLALFAVLYRLYYADWYIAMNVVVTGFLYTIIGVYLGRGLGQGLRRVRP